MAILLTDLSQLADFAGSIWMSQNQIGCGGIKCIDDYIKKYEEFYKNYQENCDKIVKYFLTRPVTVNNWNGSNIKYVFMPSEIDELYLSDNLINIAIKIHDGVYFMWNITFEGCYQLSYDEFQDIVDNSK